MYSRARALRDPEIDASIRQKRYVFAKRVHTAIVANRKNKTSLFQNTKAVARHKSASWERGSSDQSNMRVSIHSAKTDAAFQNIFSRPRSVAYRYLSVPGCSMFSFLNA